MPDNNCSCVPNTSEDSLMMIVLMNLWCYSLLLLVTLFGILVSPLLMGVCTFILHWPTDRTVRLIIWLYGRCWLLIMWPFVSFRREQMEFIKQGTPCLFVVNHLSFFDTYCMAMLPVFNIAFAVRSWPFKMFWYSSFMHMARYLDVEGSSWEDSLGSSRKTFAGGGSVLFFPEGHRSRDGQLQRFYSGGFKIAIATGVPVVALCISGTDQLLPPGRKWLKPCRVTLRALEPIDSKTFEGADSHLRLRRVVKTQMTAALKQMQSEACR